MSNPNTPYDTVSASQIVECVAASVRTKGLQRAMEDFEGMQNILSGLFIWGEIKQAVDPIFAQERQRLEELDLARAKASAPTMYQIMPGANGNINLNNPTFDGAMYEIKDNKEVKIGGPSNG
jgi:hypothetical protein